MTTPNDTPFDLDTKFWHLIRKGDVIYDTNDELLVEAIDEVGARRIASECAADEGAETWLNPDKSWCEPLVLTHTSRVVLIDFHAG